MVEGAAALCLDGQLHVLALRLGEQAVVAAGDAAGVLIIKYSIGAQLPRVARRGEQAEVMAKVRAESPERGDGVEAAVGQRRRECGRRRAAPQPSDASTSIMAGE